jgi:hypothetical protein
MEIFTEPIDGFILYNKCPVEFKTTQNDWIDMAFREFIDGAVSLSYMNFKTKDSTEIKRLINYFDNLFHELKSTGNYIPIAAWFLSEVLENPT